MTATVILVTGGNRGIGFFIVQLLAQHASLKDTTVLMGCRDVKKAEKPLQELAALGINNVKPIEIDITSDDSIRAAISHIKSKYQRLDILVNNAGLAIVPQATDFSDLRKAFNDVYNVNVSSTAVVTNMFLPLLRTAKGKVIQMSSSRGSFGKTTAGGMPVSFSPAYNASKSALNMMTLELSQKEENRDVEFHMVCPGHCSTDINAHTGTRSPKEGANVVVEVAVSPSKKTGFWETHGDGKELVAIPW